MEHRMHVSRTPLLAAAVVAVLAPGMAGAQTSADGFERMTQALQPDQKLVITDLDGRKTTGRVVVATPASITLSVPDGVVEQRRSFNRAGIATVRRTDSLWNGMLIGAGAGFVATEIWTRQACGHDIECAVYVRLAGWGALAGGGMAVGALIDKFTGNDVIYRAGATPSTLRMTPFLGPRRTGLSMALTF
jgi:hypothetical protein